MSVIKLNRYVGNDEYEASYVSPDYIHRLSHPPTNIGGAGCIVRLADGTNWLVQETQDEVYALCNGVRENERLREELMRALHLGVEGEQHD